MSDLDGFRKKLDSLDTQILSLLAERLRTCDEVAYYKRERDIPMMQPDRVRKIKERVAGLAAEQGVDSQFARDMYGLIIEEACRREEEIIDGSSSDDSTKKKGGDSGDAGMREVGKPPLVGEKAVILGGSGAVGTLLGEKIGIRGESLTVADHQRPSETVLGQFLQCDLGSPTEELRGRVAEADLVIAALPEEVALETVPAIAPHMKSGSVLVDTLSVKTTYAEMADGLRTDAELLSINPMFAPSLGFSGQAVAAVKLRPGPTSERFLEALHAWRSRVFEVDAEKHDRLMAAMQGGTHAAIISFGVMLHEMGYTADEALGMAPPPHGTLLALVARIASGEPSVYREIQTTNPFASEARKALSDSLAELERAMESRENFANLLEVMASSLGQERRQLGATCERLFETLRQSGRGLEPPNRGDVG